MRTERKPRLGRLAVVLVITVAMGFLLLLWIRKQREPRYEGKPLGFWVKALYDTRHQSLDDSNPTNRFYQVNKALLELGNAAAPSLAKALVHPASPLGRFYFEAYHYRIHRLKPPIYRLLPRPYSPGIVRLRAYRLLREMGTNASTAVPQLFKGLKNEDSETQRYCVENLGLIGPKAEPVIPALTDALGHSVPMIRSNAAQALEAIGPSSVPHF